MPSFGDVCLGFLLADGGDNLTGDLFDGHHPEESFAFRQLAVGTGTWGIAAVIPKYLSLRLPTKARRVTNAQSSIGITA